MIEPLSITAACLSIIASVSKTSTIVRGFALSYRDARRDLVGVNRELADLRMVLILFSRQPALPAMSMPMTSRECTKVHGWQQPGGVASGSLL